MSRDSSPFPKEFWERMKSVVQSDTERQSLKDALEKMSGKPPRGLRLNPLRLREKGWSVEDAKQALDAASFRLFKEVPWEARGFFIDLADVRNLSSHPYVGAGLFYLQEPGAMEAVALLDPQPGELVLDMCAAPGGKSTQIGERLAGRGWLVANDPVRPRAERLNSLVARHGILNASVFALDPTALADRFPAYFDRVLVDAPCSGESLFAKRREKRSDVRDADVAGCARRQFVIIDRAARTVKAGGRLVYSTCTYSREENEGLVAAFLNAHEGWKLLKEQRRWPHIEGVAGGYAALLQAPDVLSPAEAEGPGLVDGGTHGLLRHGPLRWNGEQDLYATSMSASPVDEVLAQFPEVEKWPLVTGADAELMKELPAFDCDEKKARAYLEGQAITSFGSGAQGWVKILFEELTLGPAKAAVERLNNHLPKILRSRAGADDAF